VRACLKNQALEWQSVSTHKALGLISGRKEGRKKGKEEGKEEGKEKKYEKSSS
jgi:flagellar biosynthesis/type III secretory pathway protein FliH